ncbi:hypothetical protein FACS189499_03950 [Clostridia bacterium]|nr:hypothetical protein FACS189499_03950 [Clostridia bacterium]
MTESEKITALKVIVGDGDADDVLSVFLKLAGSKILARAYPYDSTITIVPAQYDYLQLEIAAYMLNRRGSEGQISHGENSINRTYESADVPESMIRVVTPFIGVLGGGAND